MTLPATAIRDALRLALAAALLRLVALRPSHLSALALQASAVAWIAGFGLYLWCFAPWLARPRADAATTAVEARRS